MAIDPETRLQACALPQTCILFALPEESKPFERRRRSSPASDLRIAHSGAGPAQAERAACALLDDYPDSKPLLIICGFCGGLTPEMKPGDLILADRVVDETSDEPTHSRIPNPALVSHAMTVAAAVAPLHQGTLVTVNRVLIRAQEKQELARRTGALAVDMETGPASLMAQTHDTPWLAVRAVTDGCDDDMPLDFNLLADSDGNVSRGRVVWATLTRPWKIPGLLRLGKRSSLAAGNLAAFLETIMNHPLR